MENTIDRKLIVYKMLGLISLGLLFIFFAYWNYDNYLRNKHQLLNDLETQAQLAYSEKLDTTLMNIMDVITPLQWETDSDTIVQVFGTQNSGTNDLDSAIIQLEVYADSSRGGDRFSHFEKFPIGDLKNKENVSQLITTAFRSKRFNALKGNFPNELAPSSIERIYTRRLKEKNLPSQFIMVQADSSLNHAKDITISFTFDRFSDINRTASFEGYQGYLFKKVWPQGLLSLALYLLVCAAFYMVFKSLKEQQKFSKIKSDFISNMTHELKTPIATVSVALEAMSDFGALNDPKRSKEYLDISKHELNRLTILVDKVLKMSMFDHHDKTMNFEKIDLKSIIEEILSSMKLYFERKQVDLNVEFKGANFEMEGDRIHLTNVIYNLIDNAIKYSPDNPKINLELQNHTGKLVLMVQDFGQGISREYMDKIFNRFFREPNNDRHDIKGHGLGLSYVKEIIDFHKGKINVESEKGKGSRFYIELPRKNEHV